jgi:hypothetical protein
MVSNSTGAVARLQSLIDPKAAASPSDLAVGWRLYAEECTQISLYACAEEAAKAVEITRRVVAANPTSEARDALGTQLLQLAVSSVAGSRRLTGPPRKVALEREIAAYTELLQMFADDDRAGGKPDTGQDDRGIYGVFIDNAKEKLAELQQETASSHR